MQAVVLAAGMGTRLRELTKDRPKALVKVARKELLLHTLDFLNKENIDEVIVVTGYMADKVVNFLNDVSDRYDPKISVVKNEAYTKGNILSLIAALPKIKDSFILMNVDHIYYHPQIYKTITSNIEGITAVCDFDRELEDDDMKVLIKKDRIVKISKKLETFNGGYVGITVVPAEKLVIYKDAAIILSDKYNGNVHVEEVLQHLANSGEKILYKDISGLGWVEVDTLKDLKKAEKILRTNRSTPRQDV